MVSVSFPSIILEGLALIPLTRIRPILQALMASPLVLKILTAQRNLSSLTD